jgi:molybdopterin-guanine dinucleotide biosynthesis protein MobB
LGNEKPEIPVVCFVGPKNSGKTTLLEKVIRELASSGVRVAAVKHDAHEFEIDREGKDSFRFAAAGAGTVLVSSATKTAMVERTAAAPPLGELVARLVRGADIVLAEGYKSSRFPKIVVHRSATGKPPLEVPAGELLAVASDVPLATGALVVDLDDAPAVAGLVRGTIPNDAVGPAGCDGPDTEASP